jgi:hypothetical protein
MEQVDNDDINVQDETPTYVQFLNWTINTQMRFIRGTIHQNAYFCNFTDNKTTSTLNVQFC